MKQDINVLLVANVKHSKKMLDTAAKLRNRGLKIKIEQVKVKDLSLIVLYLSNNPCSKEELTLVLEALQDEKRNGSRR